MRACAGVSVCLAVTPWARSRKIRTDGEEAEMEAEDSFVFY